MSFDTASPFNLLQECYLERQALSVCRSATFLGCLRAWGIAPAIQVSMPKGKTAAVSASQIYGTRATFFARITLEQDRCLLTHVGEELVRLYTHWLVHEHTERYRHLKTPEQQDWLTRVVTLVVSRELMDQKYTWSCTQGAEAFADRWVCQEMDYLHLLRTLPGEMARLVHHIVRDPERQHDLLALFWAELDVRMQRHLVGPPDPLPPLPDGARLPLARLARPE